MQATPNTPWLWYGGKVPTATANKVVTMHLGNHGHKAIMAATGLSHSPVEAVLMEFAGFYAAGLPVLACTTSNVQWARHTLQLSWGSIAVWCQVAEGKVRKAYMQATGTHSQGQRNAKGGRYLQGNASLYAGPLKRTGVQVPKGQLAQVAEVAAMQTLLASGLPQLRAMAQSMGLTLSPKATKAQVVKAIAKAQA